MKDYYIVCLILCVIIAAFIPGIIASRKGHSFTKWYAYALFLFPAAFIHSLALKKPLRCIRIFFQDKKDPSLRKKKVYQAVPAEKKNISVTPGYILAVFFSKLIFGIFVSITLFSAFRTFASDTAFLRVVCVNFAIIFSMLLGIVELCRFSRLPMIADEITKRAIIFLFYSVCCSLPLYLINRFVAGKLFPEYAAFFTFLSSAIAMAIFIVSLLRKQSMYYSFFPKFFDYCTISMIAYGIYAAVSLMILSMPETRFAIHAVALPMQVLNIENLADSINNPFNLSYIYSSALAHLFVEIIILFSGLSCRNFKRRDAAARIEYRTAAFRMSRKRILRRHIPRHGGVKISPIQKV